MKADGIVIASSNRNQPDSFVGHNYSFRLNFTPLEKATDKVGGDYLIKADGGLMPPSAHTARPVRCLLSNGVKGRSSLTGFTEAIKGYTLHIEAIFRKRAPGEDKKGAW